MLDLRCPNNSVLRGANGSFTSPGFPLTYPVSVTCTWIIEVPEGYKVELSFTTFQLKSCAMFAWCICDLVQVRDGQSASSKELETICGDKQPPTLRSSGRYMWVKFDSDSIKSAESGFNATFKAVRKYIQFTMKTSLIFHAIGLSVHNFLYFNFILSHPTQTSSVLMFVILMSLVGTKHYRHLRH